LSAFITLATSITDLSVRLSLCPVEYTQSDSPDGSTNRDKHMSCCYSRSAISLIDSVFVYRTSLWWVCLSIHSHNSKTTRPNIISFCA